MQTVRQAGRGKEQNMQTFSISGNRWFDQTREPVLLLGDQGISYYNAEAERVFRAVGISLQENGALPEPLAFLESGQDMAGEVELGGRRFFASAWTVEAGRLIQLRPAQVDPVFPNERLPQLTDRLRGPLANLLSAAELLGRELSGVEGGRLNRYLAVLNQNCYRLMRLVGHLDYASILSGEAEAEFAPEVLDLAGLCREVCREVSSLGGPSLTWQDNAGGLLVMGDSALLSQMICHLIANSWRSGGDVTLQVDRRGSRAVITISDNGQGMSPPALRDAFDPSAGREGLTAAMDGLGLGIPICQHIAALHGGTMVLESRPQQGVVATVSLPVCSLAQSMEVHSPRPSRDLTGGFSPLLTELSEVLPLEVFQPEHLE